MYRRFSKPSADIWDATRRILRQDEDLLMKQRRTSEVLRTGPERRHCPNCAKNLLIPAFRHRGVPYSRCKECNHIATTIEPPTDYPYSASQDFTQIYNQLDLDAYNARCASIYQPKLEWILESFDRSKSNLRIRDMSWGELGAGAGYFMRACELEGLPSVVGYELDPNLINQSQSALQKHTIHHSELPLPELIRSTEHGIYTSWFVLEHLDDLSSVWQAFSEKPTGTIFAFSVPTFGLSTVLESVVPSHYARNLDSVFHTQIFTTQSIAHGLACAGMEIVSDWIFGQDATDLFRCLLKGAEKTYEAEFLDSLRPQFESLVDSIQSGIDHAHFSDARHVLAVKA